MVEKKRSGAKQEKLVYSTDPEKLIRLAREAGFSDIDVMRRLLAGEHGVNNRKRLLLYWAKYLGKDANAVLREAAQHGLIPNDRMPPKE